MAWVVVLLLGAGAWGGPPPSYHYGQAWWQEYEPDTGTSLLLHFGKPEAPKWKAAAQKSKQVQEERSRRDDPFADEDKSPRKPKGPGLMEVQELSMTRLVSPEAQPPAGQVLDYAHGLSFPLPQGAKIVDGGRFGAGLALTGGAGLKARADFQGSSGESMECWFRVEKLPARAACVLSINNDEGRILLLPDGRVELRRRRPHGETGRLPAEERRAVDARDASVISPQPVQVGRWTHVCAFTRSVVMQGPAPTAPTLQIDGEEVASYMTEPGNGYSFMNGGAGSREVVIGNSAADDEPLEGVIDEVRVSHVKRDFYRRLVPAWREATAAVPVPMGKPVLRRDGVVFHAPLESGPAYAVSRIPGAAITLPEGLQAAGLGVEGIRGKGWAIDPAAGFPRLDLRGINARDGAIELWVRPVNWDNFTGYWSHSPPTKPQLSIVRCFGRDKRDGQVKLFVNATLPRANDLEKGRPDIDPGHWSHVLINWPGSDLQRAFVYLNGKWLARIWRADPATLENIEPLYAELGINDDVTVARGERPVIEVDEIVGYDYAPGDEAERGQVYARWMGQVQPLKNVETQLVYKASIGRLELQVTPRLEAGAAPARVKATLLDSAGATAAPSVTAALAPGAASARLVLHDGSPLKPGAYRVHAVVEGADGTSLGEETVAWRFEPEAWRDNKLGIIDRPPPPWKPIEVSGRRLTTRMTRYELGVDGLPVQIIADGSDLLRRPMVLLEAGQPLQGEEFKLEHATAVEAAWSCRWKGRTCNVAGRFRLEYDGMICFELRIEPGAESVAPLGLVIPLKSEHATHWLFNEAGRSGAVTGLTPSEDGQFLSSRLPAFWRAEAAARRDKKPPPAWDGWREWAFLNQIDLNDRDRGLYWFADNAAGWAQSRAVDAQQVVRRGDTVELTCNFVADPTSVSAGQSAPIVFGILPHPARPLPEKYRLLERVSPAVDSPASSVFDAFRPWPKDPRGDRGSMRLYPADDPAKPRDWEASWRQAESCLPSMRLAKPTGLRTLYLSNYWFGCRAGEYDHWEWRSGPNHQVTHSPSFIDYSCWEIDQWIARGIFEAIYLDECYEAPSTNVEAGQAVTLADGTVQPGLTLFGFRQMLQRWRSLFARHGKEPMLLVHQTGSFMYPGLVFADAFLDGENRPIIAANSPDFIAQVPQHRAEALQNSRLWGVASFYMPCVWERGFDHKSINPNKRWAWRMARGVNALLAHFETGYTFAGQGEQVYRDYGADLLRWGAGSSAVPFDPYWRAGEFVRTEGQGKEVMVSLYRKPGRVLLVASNLTAAPREIVVELDREKLALGGGIKAQAFDTGWPPANGDDIPPPGKAAGGPEVEMPGDAPKSLGATGSKAAVAELEEPQKERPDVRVEGSRVRLTVRGRDFLLVDVQAER